TDSLGHLLRRLPGHFRLTAMAATGDRLLLGTEAGVAFLIDRRDVDAKATPVASAPSRCSTAAMRATVIAAGFDDASADAACVWLVGSRQRAAHQTVGLGACFLPPAAPSVTQPDLLAMRPRRRLWLADACGRVRHTLHLGGADALRSRPIPLISPARCRRQPKSELSRADEAAAAVFEKVAALTMETEPASLAVVWGPDADLCVLDPANGVVAGATDLLGRILTVTTTEALSDGAGVAEILVLREGANPPIVRLAMAPLPPDQRPPPEATGSGNGSGLLSLFDNVLKLPTSLLSSNSSADGEAAGKSTGAGKGAVKAPTSLSTVAKSSKKPPPVVNGSQAGCQTVRQAADADPFAFVSDSAAPDDDDVVLVKRVLRAVPKRNGSGSRGAGTSQTKMVSADCDGAYRRQAPPRPPPPKLPPTSTQVGVRAFDSQSDEKLIEAAVLQPTHLQDAGVLLNPNGRLTESQNGEAQHEDKQHEDKQHE
uniref:RING-type domain-containing protein n=1 Tax=Macrostomum lignano TaxID=282301 RepID=A0A1I8G926_9PLAT